MTFTKSLVADRSGSISLSIKDNPFPEEQPLRRVIDENEEFQRILIDYQDGNPPVAYNLDLSGMDVMSWTYGKSTRDFSRLAGAAPIFNFYWTFFIVTSIQHPAYFFNQEEI